MKKDRRISFDDAKSIVKTINETIQDESLLSDVCGALCRALPLYHFSLVNGKASVKENIGIMHLPVRLHHPIHGDKMAYAPREAANDIRNGWMLVVENATKELVEEPEVIIEKESVEESEVIIEDVVEIDVVDESVKMTEDRDELIAMAEQLGLEIDKRWGVKKLQEAVYA